MRENQQTLPRRSPRSAVKTRYDLNHCLPSNRGRHYGELVDFSGWDEVSGSAEIGVGKRVHRHVECRISLFIE